MTSQTELHARFPAGCAGSSLLVRLPFFSGESAVAAEVRIYRGQEAFRGGSPPAIALKTGGRGPRFFAEYTEHSGSVPRPVQQRFEGILPPFTERFYERSRNAFI